MKWIILALTLTSCTSVQYVPCPVLVHYTKDDQARLASEIQKSPQPETMRWLGDYVGLRDQVRACSAIQ
ncbi:hypothetical protein [Swingsia samuiensis]|uniref:Uncharacterized protein n=1 Tax=Swingsia samuiensis TaxID=1293412 RepID=A0A4Y6UIG5_9PROT|nr:hypothetical protein [Swingsia samuiensis]QDH17383.1 hypothetical protein E3D00_07270 [Swingsia samuiensis]